MAKAVKKKAPKPRAEKYDPPVTFAGTFEQMIAISTTGAGSKKKKSPALEETQKISKDRQE